jgi:hypothetical protein
VSGGSATGARIAGTALVVVASAGAGYAFTRSFDATAVLVPVAVAVVVPAMAMLALDRTRLPAVAVHATVTALGIGILVAAWTRAGVPGGPEALLDAALHGWRRLLNITLPAPDRPDLVLVPAALTWFSSAAGTWTALRTRSALAPGLPAVGVLLAAVVVAVPSRLDARPQAIVVVAALLGLAIVRQRYGWSAGPAARRAAGGVAVGAAVLLTAAIAGPYLSAWVPGRPYDVRDHLSTPVVPRADLSPLDRVADYRSRPDERLFTVSSTAAGPWRLAVLDRFDGHDWSTQARFTPAGLGVPPADDGAVPGTEPVRQDIELDHLRGDLLPALDRPVRLVDGVTAVDVSSGVLLGPGPTPGRRYTVVSRPPRIPARVPNSWRRTARMYRSTCPPPFRTDCRRSRRASQPGAPGPPHSSTGCGRASGTTRTPAPDGRTDTDPFLTGTRSGGPEQFATTFALAARRAGMPSRLVVGFTGGTTAGTTHTISGRDATVWVEINFAGAGWIAFDPTPPPGPAPGPTPGASPSTRPVQPSATPASQSPAPTRTPGGGQTHGPGGRSAGPTGETNDDGRTWWWLLGALLAVLAAGAMAYTIAVLAAPGRRRNRRRRARDPRARTILAWHDLCLLYNYPDYERE